MLAPLAPPNTVRVTIGGSFPRRRFRHDNALSISMHLSPTRQPESRSLLILGGAAVHRIDYHRAFHVGLSG